MAITPTQIDALPDYSNAQMVRLCRWAIAQLTAQPEADVTFPGGRRFTYRDLDQLTRQLAHFELLAANDAQAADAAAGGGQGSLVVQYLETPR